MLLIQEGRSSTLREQVTSIGPHLEEVWKRKEERLNQFTDVKAQIDIICGEICGLPFGGISFEGQDLSIGRLQEHFSQVATLHKEKVRSQLDHLFTE